MTEKGCDNCYYTYFDEKAYPCSLCIRGIERTDQWQPSKKTKADRKIEQTDCDTCKWGEWYRKGYDITMMSDECGGCCSWNNKWKPKTEPQTEYRRVGQAIDSVTGKVLGETYDVPQTDCSWQKGE